MFVLILETLVTLPHAVVAIRASMFNPASCLRLGFTVVTGIRRDEADVCDERMRVVHCSLDRLDDGHQQLLFATKPNQNAYIESFNGRLRNERLNEHWFTSLSHAKVVIEAWRREYNEERPKKRWMG